MDAAWVAEFKREIDRNKRREILAKAREEEGETPQLVLREKIIERRYDKKGDQDIDYGIRGWVLFEGLSRRVYLPGEKKRIRKELDGIKHDWNYDLCAEYGEVGEKALYEELFNITLFYIDLCERDKTYNAILLGLGHIKESRRVEKIAKEIYQNIVVIPEKIGVQEEMKAFCQAAADAFRFKFPAESHLLDDRLGG